MTDLLPVRPVEPAHDATPGHHREEWSLGEAVLVRVAGQPTTAVAGLRFPRTAAWAAHVIDLDAQAAALGERLRSVLTDLVGEAGEDAERTALINVRRDVFNNRRPRPVNIERARGCLPASAAVLLDAWTSARADAEEQRTAGLAILQAETDEVRARVRHRVADPGLRSAVLLQSQVLEREMDRYLDPSRPLDKNGRQAERTLLEILYRAAMKTSPFSTLTAVSLARLTSQAAHQLPAPVPSQQTSVRLNVAILARLAGVIAGRAELRSRLLCTIAPGITVHDDLMRYARRRTSIGADPEAVVAIDSVHENLFYLPSGPALREVVEILRDQRMPVAALAAALQAGGDRSATEVDALLGHLLRLGFLVLPQLQLDLAHDDPAHRLAGALAGSGDARLGDAAVWLTAIRGTTARFRATDPAGRAEVLGELRTEVASLFATLDASAELIPSTLLYEDAFLADGDHEISRSAWDEHYLPPLSALAQILPAFDVNLPKRLTLLGFFKARYGAGGRCTDLQRFCHEFQRDFFDPYLNRISRRMPFGADNSFTPQENWFKSPQIAAIDQARELASRLLDRAADEGRGRPEIALGADFVGQVRQALGSHSAYASPWSFFVQIDSPDRDEPGRLVLNQCYAGLTLMFSRFAFGLQAADPTALATLRRSITTGLGEDVVLAEMRGGYETTNLNLHPSITDYELVCPGEVSARRPEEQIDLEELHLVHDDADDSLSLYCPRLGKRVLPVYLGFLMPMALPEIQQVLFALCPMGMAQIDLWAGTGTPVPSDQVAPYPRISLHGMVVQRAMWKVPKDLVPLPVPGKDEAQWFLALQQWRRAHELPDRVFAQVDGGDAPTTPDDGAEATHSPDRPKASRKPLAVDFSSIFSARLLAQLVSSANSRVVFTEALPGLDGLWLDSPAGEPYVTELLVELYPTPADPCPSASKEMS